MSRSKWLSNTPPGVITAWWGWGTALVLALAIAWEPTARMLAAHDFEADEIQCRRRYQQEYAKRKAAVAKDQTSAKTNEETDPEKVAREYCVQRRSAIAGERHGDVAIWAAGVGLLALSAAFAAVVFARQAAKATRETVATMQDTARRQLRAYVSFTCQQIANFGATQPISLDCMIKNHGDTPAFKINYVFDMAVLPDPLPPGFRLPPSTIEVRQNGALFPDGDRLVWLNHSRALTAIEHTNAMGGAHRFHFWGTMNYEDVFGMVRPTKLHISAGGNDFITSMTAAAAGRPPPPFKFFHEDEHNQIEENDAS